jgi:hypothetical protein
MQARREPRMASDLNSRLSAILERHPKEEWQPIAGFPGYEINRHGQVKSHRNGAPRILKAYAGSNNGYPMVQLFAYRGATSKVCTVHRLVAQAFVPNPDNKPHVNHIDSNRANCSADNLEWCTPSENIRHAYANGRMPEFKVSPRMKLSLKLVRIIRAAYRLGCPLAFISECFDIHPGAVCKALRGTGWKTAGGSGLTGPIVAIRTRWQQVRIDTQPQPKDTP